MSKQGKSSAKNFSKIILAVVILMFIIVTSVNIYYSGQMKTLNKLSDSIERSDYKSYSACFIKDDIPAESDFLNEKAKMKSYLQGMKEDDNVFIKSKFIERIRQNNNFYIVKIKTSVYSNNDYYNFEESYSMILKQGNWVICN